MGEWIPMDIPKNARDRRLALDSAAKKIKGFSVGHLVTRSPGSDSNLIRMCNYLIKLRKLAYIANVIAGAVPAYTDSLQNVVDFDTLELYDKS